MQGDTFSAQGNLDKITMLSYSLCKELKEAEFPQKIKRGDFIYDEDNQRAILDCTNANKTEAPYKTIKIPILSELIEACGDNRYFLLEQIPKGWIACYGKDPICIKGFCKTPEEAVCKLYLKLRAKNLQ